MKYSSVILWQILFCIHVAYSVNIQPLYTDIPSKSFSFIIRQAFQISCNASADISEVSWLKDDKPIDQVEELKGRVNARKNKNIYTLDFGKAIASDFGTYYCVGKSKSGDEDKELINVYNDIAVKVPTNINVVEGEKLEIVCQVVGNPKPELSWSFKNTTFEANSTDSLSDIDINDGPETDIPNSVLTISTISMSHRGEYTCYGKSPVTDKVVKATCMVRVIDKYAALWPFLGICAEVIVLCAIIFIYEKKRNKTELEESDTDQSPDQKNTPDHGKDSNLRHRQ